MGESIPSCFKPYDIRGKVPDELNGNLAYAIGCGLADLLGLRKVVVGHDIRLSGVELSRRLIDGLLDHGCDVLNIGQCGTEEIYHAAFSLENQGVDGGVIVTASHNPADYNGMKIVLKGARPLSSDTGLRELGRYTQTMEMRQPAGKRGLVSTFSCRQQYIEHLLGYTDLEGLQPLKIVVNSGNGCAGPILDLLQERLPFSLYKLHHQPDGTFPNGVPNPLLPENREETSQAVVAQGADLGLAWDGDFDRCFFWDENGRFIEGYYLVGLLARELLEQSPGEKVLHDPRLIWNTIEQVTRAGGTPVMTQTGHAFIKERMRLENGLYGGEMSAHHYFRDFGFCDSGMIPWLLITSLLSKVQKPLSTLVDDMVSAYPVSGEINSVIDDPDEVIARIEKRYHEGEKDYTDGLSVACEDFRFNIRKSNTEPLLRLNVESRGDRALMRRKTEELLHMIKP